MPVVPAGGNIARVGERIMYPADDTIVAVSSAAGAAARAIVRLSGPDALSLAERVFAPERPWSGLEAVGGFRCVDGLLHVPIERKRGQAAFSASQGDAPPGERKSSLSPFSLDLPGRAYVFRAPRSYTRQDVVELHIPGSPVVAGALVDALAAAGARQAGPGEFTARAFFSGRIDLSAAEAVADVINAADDAQLRSAMSALGGRVSRLCRGAASALAEAMATVEASIDLADEDIQLADARELSAALAGQAGGLRAAAEAAGEMPEAAHQGRVVLAGRPNVGKSSLLNALTGQDRAIVSALAGTTRDVLAAPLALPSGQAAMLQDAAGFARVADSPGDCDSLAAAADNAAHAAVRRADVVCFVLDATEGVSPEDADLLKRLRQANPNAPMIVLANKADLSIADCPGAPGRIVDLGIACHGEAGPVGGTASGVLFTSAVTGQGLDELRCRLGELLGSSVWLSGEQLGLHARQKRCILAAAGAADRAADLLAGAAEIADAAELVAVELRAALAELGQVSPDAAGYVSEEILGRIFARFCVGK